MTLTCTDAIAQCPGKLSKQGPWHCLTLLALAAVAHADCSNNAWTDDYSEDRCYLSGPDAVVACNKKGSECGMRMSSNFRVGTGLHSMSIKAAPGSGVASTFYLSNHGGVLDPIKPRVEMEFAIMGNSAGAGSTNIWTDLWTGVADEHSKWITVPFDVTAGFHTYSFEISDTSLAWLVDGVTYRKEDLAAFHDVVTAIRSSALQEFASVWGQDSEKVRGGKLQGFSSALGSLDTNSNQFPVHASFQRGRRLTATAAEYFYP
eukprot:CAMPEP_0197628326 /NCGR_PEP_ID=MMETSP1338-20131121/6677_1 /TAXON_ID=43686 ORGANISM="Pelagodinium beii, Strain RCC1491" /NCGR_SAMPLE_ID=MMETSP1338 /ASSEMBLY_ACC=CAM_ASM_000754 /LENGTH=260 /DNA_ID=CAMNT_0043199287 /DNA_START=539 /DNA_END=1322 /DNA_ORIENTATION=+